VYLTLGTIFAEPGTFRAAIDAMSALDVELLVALGPVDPASLGDLPPSVHLEHLERFVDQAAVLRSVDLVVHTVAAAPCSARPRTADRSWCCRWAQISSTTEKR
jgi:hypothetical protein